MYLLFNCHCADVTPEANSCICKIFSFVELQVARTLYLQSRVPDTSTQDDIYINDTNLNPQVRIA